MTIPTDVLPQEDGDARPAPVVLRLVAALVDFTVVLVAVLPVLWLWTERRDGTTRPTTAAGWVAFAVIVGYPIVAIALRGCTLGKWICSVRVLAADGQPCGWLRSAVRVIVAYGPLLALGWWLPHLDRGAGRTLVEAAQVLVPIAVYAPLFTDARRRGLHDRVAGTVAVTRVPKFIRDAAVERLRERP